MPKIHQIWKAMMIMQIKVWVTRSGEDMEDFDQGLATKVYPARKFPKRAVKTFISIS